MFSSFTIRMLSPFLDSSPKLLYTITPGFTPQHTTPTSWPWHYPILGPRIFTRIRVSSPTDGQLGHPLLHMQLETWALGVLVSSYCCFSYKVADTFSSLGTFSSSFIGDPVFHPVDDYEHPLLYLPGTGISSHKTAISVSFEQSLAGICNSVWVWCQIMWWIPGWGSLWYFLYLHFKCYPLS
jgi:hypothetical protein